MNTETDLLSISEEKYYYPPEYIKATERALEDYPSQLRYLEDLGNSIAAKVRRSAMPSGEPRQPGGGVTSMPERVLEAKEQDAEYCELESYLNTMKTALGKLEERGRNFINLFYWRGLPIREVAERLNISLAEAYALRHSALSKVVHIVVRLPYHIER